MKRRIAMLFAYLLTPLLAGLATGVFYSWGDPLMREDHSWEQKGTLFLLLVSIGVCSFFLGYLALRSFIRTLEKAS